MIGCWDRLKRGGYGVIRVTFVNVKTCGGCRRLRSFDLLIGLGTYPFGAPRLFTGSAFTAGPFWQTAPKGTKKALPLRTALAERGFPLSGSAPWARRDGPSMAQHDSPGFLPGGPLRKTYARPSEGACRSKAKQSKAKQSKAKTLCVLALKKSTAAT